MLVELPIGAGTLYLGPHDVTAIVPSAQDRGHCYVHTHTFPDGLLVLMPAEDAANVWFTTLYCDWYTEYLTEYEEEEEDAEG